MGKKVALAPHTRHAAPPDSNLLPPLHLPDWLPEGGDEPAAQSGGGRRSPLGRGHIIHRVTPPPQASTQRDVSPGSASPQQRAPARQPLAESETSLGMLLSPALFAAH